MQIATSFTINNNYYTMPNEQESIKDDLVLRLASFIGRGKILLKEIEAQVSIRGNITYQKKTPAAKNAREFHDSC